MCLRRGSLKATVKWTLLEMRFSGGNKDSTLLETRFSEGDGEWFIAGDEVLWRQRWSANWLRRGTLKSTQNGELLNLFSEYNNGWRVLTEVLWRQRDHGDGVRRGSLEATVNCELLETVLWRRLRIVHCLRLFSEGVYDSLVAWDCSSKASMNRTLLEIWFSEGNCGRWFVKKEVFLLLSFVRCTETVKFDYLFYTLIKDSVSLCSDTYCKYCWVNEQIKYGSVRKREISVSSIIVF